VARIRSIKPELRTSEKVAGWPIEVRYFWVLLWGYLDDHGRGRDNPRLIKADCFPLDDKITAGRVASWLDTLERDDVIVRYSRDGQDYIAAPNWKEHQRPSHPKDSLFPDPPENFAKPSGSSREAIARTAADGSPEQGAGSREMEQGAEEQGGVTAQKRATRIPQPFIISDAMVVWARENAPLVDGKRATERFENYWLAKPGRDGVKADWERTWRNWLLRDQETAEKNPSHRQTPEERMLATLALASTEPKEIAS
jgi:hypothetical protein